MITAIVNLSSHSGTTATAAHRGSAPKYRGMKGLVRKYYCSTSERASAVGVYLWKSRAMATTTPQWKPYRQRYRAPPVSAISTRP
jgi:hypothetical protein